MTASEDASDLTTLVFEAEYAFAHWISVEIGIPYTFVRSERGTDEQHVGDFESALKFASFGFGDRGVLVGGGVEVVLPTGDREDEMEPAHGVEIEPFLNTGYQDDRFELIAFTMFGFSTSGRDENEENWELGWSFSTLFHATHALDLLIEANGERIFGGDHDGRTVMNVTPGAKIRPFDQVELQIGLGVSLPVTVEREFERRPIVSVFYHF